MEVIQISPATLELYIEKAIRDLTESLKKPERVTTSPDRLVNYHLQILKQSITKEL